LPPVVAAGHEAVQFHPDSVLQDIASAYLALSTAVFETASTVDAIAVSP